MEQGALAHIRLVISCVANHKERFRQAMGAKHRAEAKRELAQKRKQYTQAERRIEELDRLFKRIYEDFANEKLSESRFQMLSADYEAEQENLREKLLLLYVHTVVKEDGVRVQDIDISYDLVGILPASLVYGLQNDETA